MRAMLQGDGRVAITSAGGMSSWGLAALAATVGSFSMTCLTAAAFQIDPPATDPTPLAQQVARMSHERVYARLRRAMAKSGAMSQRRVPANRVQDAAYVSR
jgi:hypothetical protein